MTAQGSTVYRPVGMRLGNQGTPQQIEALIREEVAKLGSREGGLMMIYGLYPGVPLANVAALMKAMETAIRG